MGAVAENAPISSVRDRWPVVLISHGTGGAADMMGWLGIALAKQGYIALAVSHHGNTAIEPYLPEGFVCWWERASDLTSLLDYHAKVGPMANLIDPDNIYAAGFSLGGYTVLAVAGAKTNLEQFEAWQMLAGKSSGPREFPKLAKTTPDLLRTSQVFRESMARHGETYCDPRIRAVFVIAPAPPVRSFEAASLKGIRIPVGLIVGYGDTEAPAQDCSCWLQEQNNSFQLHLLDRHVGHYVFLPESTAIGKQLEPDLCCDNPFVDRSAIHRHVATLVHKHFMVNRLSSQP